MRKRTEKDEALLRRWQRKAEEAGEGAWFRNGTIDPVRVEVTFYPKLQLWIHEGGERRKITREELERDYFKLRL